MPLYDYFIRCLSPSPSDYDYIMYLPKPFLAFEYLRRSRAYWMSYRSRCPVFPACRLISGLLANREMVQDKQAERYGLLFFC